MVKKRVVTCCGSGIASSTIIAQKIMKACAERGIDVEVKPIAFRELEGQIGHIDLVVSISPGVKYKDVPVVNGVPFLTGVGQSATMDRLIQILTGGEI
jgi:PTS system galactitol-specific IIB component